MCFLPNSEDPDEMTHNATFSQELHYLRIPKDYIQRNKYYNPSIRHLPSNFLTDRSKAVLLLYTFLLFVFRVCLCHSVLSIPCSLKITRWERADLLALLCMMFSCVFPTFPYGVLSWVWYLMVSIPDFCLLLYL